MSVSQDGRIDLTLWGISDFELLGIVDDLADGDGWTETMAVRLQLGEKPEKGIRSGVGNRLSWMSVNRENGYGWLEGQGTGSQKDPKRWRLTAIGHALLENPKLSAAFERTFQGLNPAQRLALTRELGESADAGAAEIRTALRRQWQRSLGR